MKPMIPTEGLRPFGDSRKKLLASDFWSQALATFSAASFQDFLAIGSFHASAEAMATAAFGAARL
jgi:hypothetical protein